MNLLSVLPPPPEGLTGWPWTEQSPAPPAMAPNGEPWPRITIVTPSFGQGHFIEETIRSILLQNYPNVEYFVMDGGSTDSTVDVLKKYERWLAGWVSEKDRGQSHAINKGFARSHGAIHAYMNSDDYYLPGAFVSVAERFVETPRPGIVHGICRFINEGGEKVGQQLAQISSFPEIIDLWNVWWKKRQFVQPEVFWSADLHAHVGPFREDLNFVMDYEFWQRLLRAGGLVRTVQQEVSAFRFTAVQKSTQRKRAADELLAVVAPILNDEAAPIPAPERRRLKKRWTYHARFLRPMERSVEAGESRPRRWLRLGGILLKHPGLLASPQMRIRVQQVLQGRKSPQ